MIVRAWSSMGCRLPDPGVFEYGHDDPFPLSAGMHRAQFLLPKEPASLRRLDLLPDVVVSAKMSRRTPAVFLLTKFGVALSDVRRPTNAVQVPARSPASISLDESPIIHDLSRSNARSSAAAISIPGAGFRQSQLLRKRMTVPPGRWGQA
jgi:hypothetical protein